MASLTCDYCGKDLHKSKEIFLADSDSLYCSQVCLQYGEVISNFYRYDDAVKFMKKHGSYNRILEGQEFVRQEQAHRMLDEDQEVEK